MPQFYRMCGFYGLSISCRQTNLLPLHTNTPPLQERQLVTSSIYSSPKEVWQISTIETSLLAATYFSHPLREYH